MTKKRKKLTPAEQDAERREAITNWHEERSMRAILRGLAVFDEVCDLDVPDRTPISTVQQLTEWATRRKVRLTSLTPPGTE